MRDIQSSCWAIINLTSGPFGETCTCRPRAGEDLEAALQEAIRLLPEGRYDGEPTAIDIDLEDELGEIVDSLNNRSRRTKFFIDQPRSYADGRRRACRGQSPQGEEFGHGIPEKHVGIIKKLTSIRDAVREVLKAQEQDRPWRELQVRLRIAWSSFVRDFGPINHTTVSISEDEESRRGARVTVVRTSASSSTIPIAGRSPRSRITTSTPIRRTGPDLFRTCDLAAGPARNHQCRGRVGRGRSTNAVALTSSISPNCCTGRPTAGLTELGDERFRQIRPTSSWQQTADAYLAGPVRTKLAVVEAAAALVPAYERNVRALQAVLNWPTFVRPDHRTPRCAVVSGGLRRRLRAGDDGRGDQDPPSALSLGAGPWRRGSLVIAPPAHPEWGTSRRDAGELLADALNSRVPQIFDNFKDAGGERRVLNVVDTEAARDKLQRIKEAFQN